MLLVLVAGVLILGQDHLEQESLNKFEYPLLVLLDTLGMMAMISCNNLLGLFLALEIQSLSLYVLVSMARQQKPANEAGLKYFILGVLSSCFLLFGISLVYGFTGSIEFESIASVLALSPTISIGMMIGVLMVLVGIAFKLSLVPFHMWTPDVYSGSPTPVTLFLAAGPKIAAFGLLTQVLSKGFFPGISLWASFLMAIALLSIVLGAFGALFQKTLKRLIAYSTISHMGFMTLGFLSGTAEGLQASMTYMVLYGLTTLGIFGVLLSLRSKNHLIDSIEDLKGLSQQAPKVCLCFGLLLFSLAGVPPLGGFFAKLGVLKTALEAGYTGTVILAVVASVVSAGFYLKILKVMYFESPSSSRLLVLDTLPSKRTTLVLMFSTLIIALYALGPLLLDNFSHASVATLNVNA